jgi:hypothetical protein
MTVFIKKKFETVDDGIENLISAAIYDYSDQDYRIDNINEGMNKKFADGFVVKKGKKYIKIISDSSAWAFVVNTDDDKLFKKGDLLKCAGWAAPARNKPRGNVLEGGYRIEWTGPQYL